MLTLELRARRVRAIVDHFKRSAAEATNPTFRALMLRTAAELEDVAADLETAFTRAA